MKNVRRILSVLLTVALLATACLSFYAYAAPRLTSIKILQKPEKTTFYQGEDWDYGEWNQPGDTGPWVWESGNRISFLRNGGCGFYPDAGMIDARGLKIEATYSDGSKKTLNYTEVETNYGYYQNIIISPEKGAYKVGKMKAEVWLEENLEVYATYEIELLTNILGDLTNDGKINSSDALKVLQYSVGLISLTSHQKKIADLNSDGKINSSDALFILQKSVGL